MSDTLRLENSRGRIIKLYSKLSEIEDILELAQGDLTSVKIELQTIHNQLDAEIEEKELGEDVEE